MKRRRLPGLMFHDARHRWASPLSERDRDPDYHTPVCAVCGKVGMRLVKPNVPWRRVLVRQIYAPSPLYWTLVRKSA